MNYKNKAHYLLLLACALLLLSYPDFAYAQGRFIPNLGQWNDTIVSKADIKGGAVFLCKDQIRYNFMNGNDIEKFHDAPYKIDTCTLHGQSFFLQWQHASPAVRISSQYAYPEYYNYYRGNDPAHWKSGVHAYSDVNYKELYPGIDLQMSADGPDLEYTYTVSPGTDPSAIQIKISGAEGVYVKDSDLYIYSPMVQIIEKSPFAYQMIGDAKTAVPCLFDVQNGVESFTFPAGYRKDLPLVIDPVVIFATYSGSYVSNFGFTGTYDSLGNSYAGGIAFGTGFPTTAGAYQVSYQGGTYASLSNYLDIEVFDGDPRDVGILKFTPDGKNLIYATYLGGKKGNEQPTSMVVDHSGNLLVFGSTASADFPVTSGAFQSSLAGMTDMYLSKFSPDGKKLLASTLIGGSDIDGLNGVDTLDNNGNEITQSRLCYNYGDQFRGEVTVDNGNNFYVASSTFSSNFPTTSGSYQPHKGGGKQDGCVLKIDSNLHKLIWSTYLGGTSNEGAYSLALDHHNGVFVCGGTLSPYFFPAGPAYQKTAAGDADGYIAHIKNDGSTILGATYYGTSAYDQTYIVRLDNSDNAYVFGQTLNTNFPSYNVKYNVAHSGNFITKFNNSLTSIIYSTDIGSGSGAPDMSPAAFLVDKCERVYISGWGSKLSYPNLSKLGYLGNMPTTSNAMQKTTDHNDFYLAVYERNLDTLLYGTYFGGPISQEHVHGGSNDFDKNGIVYENVCGGCGGNSDFPTTPGAWSATNNSNNCNNLLFKVDMSILQLRADFIAPQYACGSTVVSFKNASRNGVTYQWFFGDSTSYSTDSAPTHKYAQFGTYTVTMIATNPNSCILHDTIQKTITIYAHGDPGFTLQRDSCSLAVSFFKKAENTTTNWYFGDDAYSDSANPVHVFPGPGHYTVRLIVDSGTSCEDSFSVTIPITSPKADFKTTFATCSPSIIHFINESKGALKSRLWYLPFASTDTSKNPAVNFNGNPGTYTVSLVVTDSTGCKDSIAKKITVYTKPNAAFIDSAYACATRIFVKNTSTGVNSYRWYFSDGTTASADSLVHAFPNDSLITVTLITDSGSPCADTIKKTFKTHAIKAGFKYSIDTCAGTVIFTNTSAGASVYMWKFDAKDSSTSQNATFTFPHKGIYSVKLTAFSTSGCADSLSQAVNITDSGHVLFIPNVFTPNNDIYNNTFTITGMNPCDTYNVSIYNRWGQLLYHAYGNSNFSWDGYFHHVKVAEGVYYYVFHGRKEGELKGTVTVIY